MGLSVFVQDGFTITDTIPGIEGLYPPVRFTYRPCSEDEAAEFAAVPAARSKAARAALILSHVQGQVVSIVETKPDGTEELTTVALTAAAIGKLHSSLSAGIFFRVLGQIGPSAASEGN